MRCFTVSLLSLLVWLPAVSLAQSPPKQHPPATVPLLGAYFLPVPEILYQHLTELPAGQGLVVERVKAKSPAARMGLQPYDVLLRFANRPVTDVQHLAGLLWALPPGNSSKIEVIRNGKPLMLSCQVQQADLPALPKALVKPVGPPAVNVQAEPLPNGKLKLTLTYYAGNGGKLEALTCTGNLEEIETQIRQRTQQQDISPRVQELLDVALRRLRMLNLR